MIRPLPLLALASLGAAAIAAPAVISAGEPNASLMSTQEIRAHNEGLEKTHPDFITCKRYTVTGTLAKRQRVCLTKAAWEKRAEDAQNFANQRIEGARNSACGDCPTGG